MIRRFIVASILLSVGYLGFLSLKFWSEDTPGVGVADKVAEEEQHKVYSFSFSKYTPSGEKEIEIEGDTANVLSQNVILSNVIAKAYAEEGPVMITADDGEFNKGTNIVHLENNVVAATQEGARLLTPSLDIHPATKLMETEDRAVVRKDNIDIEGDGARGDSGLKKVQFHKNVTVVIQSDDPDNPVPTIITCDGPLNVDYANYVAHFRDNVVTTDHRGKLTAEAMDVYYDKSRRRVDKIVAQGNVVIMTADGNATYGDKVIYYAKEGRIVIGGSTEAVYFPGSEDGGGTTAIPLT